MTSPSAGIPYVPEGTLNPAAGLNAAIDTIDALLQTRVLAVGQNTPPGSPENGDCYIVGTGTGAFSGQDNNLARYVAEGALWQFFEAGIQVRVVLNMADDLIYVYTGDSSGGTWTAASGGSANASHGAFESLTIDSGNEVTIDLSLAGMLDLVLTDDVTAVNIDNIETGEANFFTLRISQDNVGGRSFTPPASWLYPSGAGTYVVSSDPDAVDLLQGISYDDGATWLVTYQQDYA